MAALLFFGGVVGPAAPACPSAATLLLFGVATRGTGALFRLYVHHTLLSSHPLLLLYYWAEALGQGVGGGGGFGGLCCILRQLQP